MLLQLHLNPLDFLRGVDNNAALGKIFGNLQKALAQPAVKRQPHALVTVFLRQTDDAGEPLHGTLDAYFRIEIENKRQVRLKIPRHHLVKIFNHLHIETHAIALKSAGGIRKTVGDHPLPLFQGWPYLFHQMLAPRGKKQ